MEAPKAEEDLTSLTSGLRAEATRQRTLLSLAGVLVCAWRFG